LRIIDSVGWIAYFKRAELASHYRDYILDSDNVMTPSIIVYEVFKHILAAMDEEAAKLAIATLVNTEIVPLSEALAAYAARVGLAHKLPMADAIIYATALSAGATLVTSDTHFQGLPLVEFIPRPARQGICD